MPLRRSLSLAAVGAVLLASCGGGSEESASTVATTTTLEAPADAAGADTTITTVAPTVDDVDLGAFCDASLEYAVLSDATELVEAGNVAAFATLIASAAEALFAVVEAAPSDEYTDEPIRLLELIEFSVDEYAFVDFDATRADELSGEFFEAIEAIEAIEADLDSFLLDPCGIDIADFQFEAAQLALDVAIEVQEFVGWSDDSGHIVVDVPIEWIDVDGAPEGDADVLSVAPSMEAFDPASGAPGIFIAAFDSSAVVWQELLQGETESWVNADGCSVVDEFPYDDATYLGSEVVLGCPGTTAVTRLIGGTNAAGSVTFIIVLVHPEGRDDIRDRVEATVFVDVGRDVPTESAGTEAAPPPPPPPAAPKPPVVSASALCPDGFRTVPPGTYPVRPCQRGETVEIVQSLLRDLGYDIAVDGYWGDATAAALRQEFGEDIVELIPADIEALRDCGDDC